ncbi:MAG: zinc-dependent alcohol dehydrogenase [Bacteroidota bacterium]
MGDSGAMDAIQFRHSVPGYLLSRSIYRWARGAWSSRIAPISWTRLPRPRAQRDGWVRLRVRRSGICGTDASLLTGSDSLFLEPEATYPFVPGHELVGEVLDSEGERGLPAGLQRDARVAVWAVLGCAARGSTEPCPACAAGWEGQCERRGDAWPGRGLGIGFSRETGGGWSEECLAHVAQVWPLPDSVADDDAVLLDPAATALAALLRTQDPGPRDTLVIGGGTIGLLCMRLAKALGLPGSWTIVVRHEFQRAWARRSGHAAVRFAADEEFRGWLQERGARSTRITGYGSVTRGVFDRVIVAAASRQALGWALDAAAPRAVLALVAAPDSIPRFDPTPVWYRELTIRGIYDYGPVPWEGGSRHPYSVLIPMLSRGELDLRDLVTHSFRLAEWRKALDTAVRRDRTGAIKVVFRPGRS